MIIPGSIVLELNPRDRNSNVSVTDREGIRSIPSESDTAAVEELMFTQTAKGMGIVPLTTRTHCSGTTLVS
jgi:hypothetical protein